MTWIGIDPTFHLIYLLWSEHSNTWVIQAINKFIGMVRVFKVVGHQMHIEATVVPNPRQSTGIGQLM